MKKYQLICMAGDGSYVINSTHSTIAEAEETSANIGSKWIFYPFHFVLSGTRIVSTGCGLIRVSDNKPYLELLFKGRYLKTVEKAFNKTCLICDEKEWNLGSDQFEDLLIETNRKLIKK